VGRPIKPGPDPHNPPPANEIDLYGINILWGILSTPVIDPDTNTMYVVNWSSPDGTVPRAVHQLHAINITSGAEVRPPLTIGATSDKTKPPKPPATFFSPRQKQRSALLLVASSGANGTPARKTLYVACSMTTESDPNVHGWVMAFDVVNFQPGAVWCTTPNSSEGGIWQASQGPAADENGDVFVITSNTNTARTPDPDTDFPESFVELRYTPAGTMVAGKLEVIDWFTPFLDKSRAPGFQDEDLGSGGAVVLPGMGIVLGSGKDGVLYVLNKDKLGKGSDPKLLMQPPIFFTYFPGFGVDPSKIKDLDNTHLGDGKTHHLHGTPVFWKSPKHGPMLFVWGENEALRAWTIDNSGKTTFLAQGAEIASAGVGGIGGMPGGMLALSANGSAPNTGIVWATAPLNGDANKHVVEGILRAYDATNLDPVANPDGTPRLKRLWDSKQIPGNTFNFSKFCPPIIADGRVFVPTYDGRVDVYELVKSPPHAAVPVNAG
jgi:outer membrane protein assembly factor BamB